ncbi:hypothetical protein PHYBOEH_000148 [Phytophthora boehmeriae]|uniref:RCC1-like domain-containing protein n=1 Tax=Phytophthora boehmeriae TaxID=109152 RepID=A0A8T1X725_9STRA|nr:hypothetical protein PHYBOEH_000148 [Phytophthora boehmeriae]
MQARRRAVIERCLQIIRFMAPPILMYALAARPNEPPVFWYTNAAEINVFYWNYREYVRRSGGKPTLIKVENNVLEITRRVLRREHALVSRIQARWRGLTTRMIFREFKQQKGWLKGIQQSPAIKIQRLFRGHESRRFCRTLQVKIKYPAQREAYRREIAMRKQQVKATDFRDRLLAKYKYQFQIKRTTRMMVQQVKLPLASSSSAKKYVGESVDNEENESELGPETHSHVQHSLKATRSNNSRVEREVRDTKAMSIEAATEKMTTGATQCAVVAFGCNDDGQVGTGAKRRATLAIDDVSASNFPQTLSALTNEEILAVSCGSRHTMALTATGSVYSWGWGSMGQLGHGDHKSIHEPLKIDFFEKNGLTVDYISCGGCHSAAVTKDGSLYMWGETHWGQLGLPKESLDSADVLQSDEGNDGHDKLKAHVLLPIKCPILEEGSGEIILKVSCGGTHTAALTNLGRVYVWGRGDSGQLGIGSTWLQDTDDDSLLGVSRPHLVEGFNGEKVVQVACGAFHSAAVTDEGHVYIWGKEDYGMLGVGQTSDQQTPKRVEFFDTIPALRVSCGGWHTVVVAKSGDCYAFGRGEYGRLGLGDTKSRTRPHLVKALQGKTVIQAACGGSHTLFVTSDGVAYVAGRPDHGRLGLTDIKSLMVPTQLDLGLIPVRQVSAGGAHSVAVMHSSRPIFSPMISPLPTSNPIPHRELA